MTGDIVKRLRVNYVVDDHTWEELEQFALRNEAACAIEARDAEIKWLRAERDACRSLAHQLAQALWREARRG